MTNETRHPGSRGMPRTRRVALPRIRTQVRIHPGDRTHPDGVSQASGTTNRRARAAPAPRRIKI